MWIKTRTEKRVKLLKSPDFTRLDVTFAVRMIQTTTITTDRLMVAEKRASRARDARSAKFLDQYRTKVAA